MSRIVALLRAVRSARWRDIYETGEAQIALLKAQAVRWIRPNGEFVEVSAPESDVSRIGNPAQVRISERLGQAVDRASRYGVFRPLCLTRAVALCQMLDSRGINGHRIRVGVRRDGGTFFAHAWVEVEHVVVGDNVASTRHFRPLTDLSVAGSRAEPRRKLRYPLEMLIGGGDIAIWDR